MVKSEQKRQQKMARKQAKDRQKRKQIIQSKQQLASAAGQMLAACTWPVMLCSVDDKLPDAGMGTVLFARQSSRGMIAVTSFVLDIYCLGVKDVIACMRTPDQARSMFEHFNSRSNMRPIEPGLARGLVEGAIAYAESLGFHPHADYRKAAPLWGDIQPTSVEGHYEFGKEGKPLYLNGPYEDLARQQAIVHQLEKVCGAGNFNVIKLGGMLSTPGRYIENDYEDGFDDSDEDDDQDDGQDDGQDEDDSVVSGEWLTNEHTDSVRRIDS